MSKTIAVGGTQNDGFVGDIVTSTLTEAQFQAQRNGTWVLMDGRAVGGSRYSTITGSSTIPDARGMFLRSKNNGRVDGLQNPDGDLALGTYQADAFASHTHIQNAHTHTQNAHTHAQDPHTHVVPNLVYAQPGVTNSVHNELWISGNTTTGSTTAVNQSTTAVNQNATAVNQNSGGNETRPKNITVNYFIKIN